MNAVVLIIVGALLAVINRGEGLFSAYLLPLACVVLAVVMSPIGAKPSVAHDEAQALARGQGRALIYHRPG